MLVRMARIRFPRELGDLIAFIFMIVMIVLVVLYQIFMILPTIYHETTTFYYVHILAWLFVTTNILLNLYFILTVDATSGSVVLPSILKEGWRFCSACESNAPPRSHHCIWCNRCILKCDHHCVFTGNCVGFSNHRYFIGFLIWLWIASVYSSLMNMDYTWELLGDFTWRSVVSMLLPILSWMFGLTKTFTFTVAYMSAFCLICFFLLGTFLAYHFLLIYNGQTTRERAHNKHEYNLGWSENVKEVLGANWRVAWFFPLIPSPLRGNGISFVKKGESHEESVKDM